jgi:hypothetical protein
MAKVRVINIGDQLLISLDNKEVNFYDKSKSVWFASSGIINFIYDGELVFQEHPENFTEPSESSVVDLLLLLNDMLLVAGSMPEKLISSDYTLTNADANYLILVDLSANDITLKMPKDARQGLSWQIKDNGNAGTYICVISGNGTNVEGIATAPDITVDYEARQLYLSALSNEYLIL